MSGVLGMRGWPAVAEEAIIARDCLLAAHVGSRLHVCHVSTAGSVELIRWAKSKGWTVTAEVTPHHLLLTDDLVATLRPDLQGQPAAAHGRRRRGAARRPRRRHHRLRRHRPRPAPHRGQGVRVGGGRDGHARPRDRAQRRPARDGRHRAARLGRRRRPDVGAHRRGIGRVADHGTPLEAGAPANLTLVDPAATRVIDPTDSASLSRNTPVPRARAARRGRRDVPARHGRPSSTGSCSDRRQPTRPGGGARPRGRPDLPRRRVRRRRRDRRRGGLLDRDDRLPGDAHRPVVPPAGRGDDRPHVGNTGVNDEDPESARIWVAGYVVRDPARRAEQLALAAQPRRGARRAGRRRDQRHRHPRPDPPPARARRHAGRDLVDGATPTQLLERVRRRRRWPGPPWPTRSPRPSRTSSRLSARSG